MKFKVSAVLPTPAAVYFIERDSSAFRSLVARMSNLESLEMGKSWMEGEAEVYEFITKPDIERYVPKQFTHFIPGGDLHYVDVIRYDPKEIDASPYRMHVKSIPPIFSSKAKIESTLTIEEETADTCRQTLEGNIHIKLIGIGPIAERIVVDNLKNVYKHVPKIVEKWVAFRNEVMEQPGGRDVLVSGRPQNLGVQWISDGIKKILKEDLPPSESSSEASSLHHPEHSRDYSMDSYSTEESSQPESYSDESDEDVFFDAREQTSWLDMSQQVAESFGQDPKLERQLESDTKHTNQLIKDYRKSGRRLKAVRLDDEALHQPDSTKNEHTLEHAGPSRRFSVDYNQDLQRWTQFWEEQEVPQRPHNPAFKARLANLFRIGADAGMFKKRKERKHLVPWIHRKHKHKESQSSHDGSDQADVNALSLKEGGSRSTDRSEDQIRTAPAEVEHLDSKGHRRKKSVPMLKGLFTRVTYEDPSSDPPP